MALIVKDRVKETTAVTGTGDATLLGAQTGYQSFSVIGNGNQTYYTISSNGGTEWEVGVGVYNSVGNTLTRDFILSSSNGGAPVNFSAGTKDIYVVYPASKATYQDASQNIIAGVEGVIFNSAQTIVTNTTLPTNSNGFTAGPVTINAFVTVTVPSGAVWTVI